MAYRRKNYKRKYVKKSTAGVKALKMVKQIKRVTKPEVKIHDQFPSTMSVSNTGTVYAFNNISQGIHGDQRVGDTINPLALEYRFNCWTDDPRGAVRIIFFRSRNESDLPITPSTILDFPDFLSPYSIDHRQEFTVLSDRSYPLTNGKNNVIGHKRLKLTGRIKWKKNSVSIETGGVYMLAIRDDNHAAIEFFTRLTYTDA